MIDPAPSVSAGNRSALYRLFALVVGVVLLTLLLHGFDVLIVVLALVIMVMAHEGGHFVTAKLSGMKVTEYFLGFGPKVLSFRRGETEYGVKAIPAGGYVKIVGMTTLEEVDPLDEPRSYRQSTFPRRLLVGVAGSTMHFVMAFLLLWGMVAFAGLPSNAAEIGGFTHFTNAVSPAKAAGLRAGDVVVSVNGKATPSASQFVNFVHAHPNARLDAGVRRAGKLVQVVVESADARHLDVLSNGVPTPEIKSKSAIGVIGIELGQSYVTENPLAALGRGGAELGGIITASFAGLGQIFSPHGLANFAHSVTSARAEHAQAVAGNTGAAGNSGQLVSILGAVQIGAQAAHQNISELLFILASVNVFVGIINLVPMLPLDGGHVAIAVYERVRSRHGRRYHADIAKLMPVAYLFLAFILVLGLGALYANAVNPVHLPGG